MALDRLAIGERIRYVREKVFDNEIRVLFAERCGLTESHVGQIERGEIMISLTTLDKISTATGTDPNFILYGLEDNKKSTIRRHIDMFLDRCNKEELKMYFKCISSIETYIFNTYTNKKTKK